ncbi:hypothetical protein HYY75_09340, partial [bacterium]|nr:hypothetical protein [bacterium]
MPIFSLIHKDVGDTDLVASQTFAVNIASDILNSLLDNVPFEAIRKGSPATIGLDDLAGLKEYENSIKPTKKLAKMLFPGEDNEVNNGEWRCQGIIADPRGICYQATLRVDDVLDEEIFSNPEEGSYKVDGSEFPSRKSVTFAFCQNPATLLSPSWVVKEYISPTKKGTPTHERQLPQQLAVSPESIYVKPDFITPKTSRFTQNLSSAKVNYVKDKDEYCNFKRLIVQIQWNMEKP